MIRTAQATIHSMILVFKSPNGSAVVLHLDDELQGYEFLESTVEFRFVRAGVPISDWAASVSGYVSLLSPVIEESSVRTRGLYAANLAIETRGVPGVFTLFIWLRD